MTKEDINIFDYISQDRYLQIIDDCIQNGQDVSEIDDKIRDEIYENIMLASKKSDEKTKDEKVKTSRTRKFTGGTYEKELNMTAKIAPIITEDTDFDRLNGMHVYKDLQNILTSSKQYNMYMTDSTATVTYGVLREMFFYLVEKAHNINPVISLSFIYSYFSFDIKIFMTDYLPSSIKTLCRMYMKSHTNMIPEDSEQTLCNSLFA